MALVAGQRLLEGKGDKTDHARILQAQLPQLLREQSRCVAPSGSFSVDVRFRHRKAGAVCFGQEEVRGRCRLHRLSNAKRHLDRLQLAERFGNRLNKPGDYVTMDFGLPLDPSLLFQRTGRACYDEYGYPRNSIDPGGEGWYFYDHTCTAKRAQPIAS